jgi:hypothetical protein
MKNLALIIVSVLVLVTAKGQSPIVKEVFRLIPAGKMYGLSLATRDSLLNGKTYYPASNDSIEVKAYNYGVSVLVEDYMFVSMSYETEQNGSGMVEIRSFKKSNGDNLFIVSETAGVWPINYQQNDLSIFIYGKSKKLIQADRKILPAIDESIFIKPGAPDSVRKIIMNNSNLVFDLSKEKLILDLNSDYLLNNEMARNWLKGDFVYFDWIKDSFVMSKAGFKADD